MPKPFTTSAMQKSKNPKTAPPSTEVVSPGRRRVFGPAEKLRIVREADACKRGELGQLLRREGIYSSYLTEWRQELAQHGVEGLAQRRVGRPPKYDKKDLQIQALQKKATRLERELDIARKLLELQKKASELLGIELASPEEP
jgi:transposase